MTGLVVATRVDRWIYARLVDAATAVGLTDPDGRVWADVAPEEADLPVLIFAPAAPPADTVGIGGGNRILTGGLWTAKAVDETGSYLDLEALADAIDAELGDPPIDTIDGVVIAAVRREGEVRYQETAGGRVYRHLGGLYRITAHPAP